MKYRANRHPTDFQIVVLHADRKMHCSMIDVSENGARLHNLKLVNVGDEVSVVSSFGETAGQVKWVRNDICGVEFANKISTQTVDAYRRRLGHLQAYREY